MHKVFFEFILQRFAALKRQLLPYEQLISTLIFPYNCKHLFKAYFKLFFWADVNNYYS